jgi:hypothetical protein
MAVLQQPTERALIFGRLALGFVTDRVDTGGWIAIAISV